MSRVIPIITEEPFIIGSSAAVKDAIRMADLYAPTDHPILLLGESGTGKSIFAKYIHWKSSRKLKPFVKVNLNTVSTSIFESELFGHERGAFTGAHDRHIGYFEQADGGTLFLDEIGDYTPTIQSKILCAIDENVIQRTGGSESIKLDLRIVFATNRDLLELIEQRLFRADLYNRIKTFKIELPPLMKRKDDIPDIIDYFLENSYCKGNKINDDAKEMVKDYPYHWPGNLRDIKGIVEKASILATNDIVDKEIIKGILKQDYSLVGPPSSKELERVISESVFEILTSKEFFRDGQSLRDFIEMTLIDGLVAGMEKAIKEGWSFDQNLNGVGKTLGITSLITKSKPHMAKTDYLVRALISLYEQIKSVYTFPEKLIQRIEATKEQDQ